MIPDGRLDDGAGVHEAKAAVSAVGAIAKPVNAERAGILAGGHTHPRGDGDGRDHTFEAYPSAQSHQTVQVFEPCIAEDNVRGSTVQPEDADFRMEVTRHFEPVLSSLWSQGRLRLPARCKFQQFDQIQLHRSSAAGGLAVPPLPAR